MTDGNGVVWTRLGVPEGVHQSVCCCSGGVVILELDSFLCEPAGPRELSLRIDKWIEVQMCTYSFFRLVTGVGTDLWSKRHAPLSTSSPRPY